MIMKILWLCNVILPKFAQALNISPPVSGGWLTGAAEAVRTVPGIELYICASQRLSRKLIKKTVDGIHFYGYPASSKAPHKYDSATEAWFRQLLEEIQPELVHIWGTEFPQALAMTRAFGQPQKTLINIQGLCKFYTDHYLAYLPRETRRLYTLRDLLRKDRLVVQQKKFHVRGQYEQQAIQSAKHIIGRTRWDRACVKQVAPDSRYYLCNETLRSSFYKHAGAWKPDTCEKHSIFVSQASYPIKGFHMVLQAMPEILKRYPDARLYTTGSNPFQVPFYRVSSYQKLLAKQIRKLGLQEHVVFLGPLDEEKMCDRFLRSHVFVSASSIENSPNSVGEAMLLGVPTVASFVGGTMDLLTDQEEGFLYQPDAPYMLAEYVCSIFADDVLAEEIGKNACAHARKTHDPQQNLQTLLTIYEAVYNQ